MGIFTRLSFIYIVSAILLAIPRERPPFVPTKTPEIIKERREIFKRNFENYHMGELILSYVAGENRGLTKEIKSAHQVLNLSHLFTPGGIHLSSLYVLFLPIFWMIGKKARWWKFSFKFFLAFTPFFLPRMWAIKRIAILRVLKILTDKLPVKLSMFSLFLISFAADFLVGTYTSSPLSFIYSFLFLGIIFTSSDYPKIFLPLTLLGGQIIIGFFQGSPLTVIGFIFGFILTALFEFLFPPIFIYFWSAPYAGNWGEFFITLYWKGIVYSSELSIKSGIYDCTLPLTLCVIILVLRIHLQWKAFLVAALLLIHCNTMENPYGVLAKDKVFLYLEGPNPRRPPCPRRLHESRSSRSSAKGANSVFQSAPKKCSSCPTRLITSDTLPPNT